MTPVELPAAENVIAVSLTKIGNDIRMLGSGPRAGTPNWSCERTACPVR